MPNKRKPHEERTAEVYRTAAEDSLELAKALAGDGGISDQDFLERMARSDRLADHDGETCGQCHNMILGSEVAREMIEAGEYEDVVSRWAAETKRRWEKSKFVKLWEKEKKASRNPRKAFKDRAGSRERQKPRDGARRSGVGKAKIVEKNDGQGEAKVAVHGPLAHRLGVSLVGGFS
jgi:hypothetical protein